MGIVAPRWGNSARTGAKPSPRGEGGPAKPGRMWWSAKQNRKYLTPLRSYTTSVICSFLANASFSSRRSLGRSRASETTQQNDKFQFIVSYSNVVDSSRLDQHSGKQNRQLFPGKGAFLPVFQTVVRIGEQIVHCRFCRQDFFRCRRARQQII